MADQICNNYSELHFMAGQIANNYSYKAQLVG